VWHLFAQNVFLEMWICCQPVGKGDLLLHDPTMTQTPGHRWSHRLWSVNFYYRKWPSILDVSFNSHQLNTISRIKTPWSNNFWWQTIVELFSSS
jgi:hypothetical protein